MAHKMRLNGSLRGASMGSVFAVLAAAVAVVIQVATMPPASATAASDFASAVMSSAPNAYYKLDDTSGTTVADSSGNGHSGTYVNSPTLSLPGAVDGSNSASFGSGARVDVPTLNYSHNSLSTEAWIRTTSTAATPAYGGDAALTIFGDYTNSVWYSFGVTGGHLRMARYSVALNSWQSVTGSSWVNDGRWHHVVATSSAAINQGAIYVDGYLDGYGALPVNSTDYAAVNRIGAGYQNQDRFVGDIDDVAVYPTVLSSADVQAHYASAGSPNEVTPPTGTYASSVADQSPVAHYRLGESSGTTAVDISGNNHSGTYAGNLALGADGVVANDTDTAVAFDGGRVDLPTLTFHGQTFSTEAWIKTTSSAATPSYEGDSALTIFGDHTGSVWFSFGVNAGHLRLARHLDATSDWQFVTGTKIVNDGSWHHVVATTSASADRGAIYVDGVLDALGDLTVTTDDAAAVTRIGAGYQNQDTFIGSIDEVAVYAGQLSATDIRTHFRAATGTDPLGIDDVLDGSAAMAALQTRLSAIVNACPAPPSNAANPAVSIDVTAGSCSVTYLTAECGWRQFFCDHKDQLIIAVAATAVILLAAPLVAALAAPSWEALSALLAELGPWSYTVPTSGLLATAGGGAGSILVDGYLVTVTAEGLFVVTATVGGTAVTLMTIENAPHWLNNYMTNHGTDGSENAVGDLGDDWVPRDTSEIPGSTDCATCAEDIKARLGGGRDVNVTPTSTPYLGTYRGEGTMWVEHDVVEFNGRVYDAFGPRDGVPTSLWKQLWEEPDYIDFDGI